MINRSFKNKNDSYYNLEKGRIASLVRKGPNIVLDLGCAAGRLGRSLRETSKAAYLVGIEIYHEAAAEAMKSYDVVYEGDIESLSLNYDRYFDYAICGDIIEHLRDPWSTLSRINRWLKANGTLICSVPNIRYWEVIWDLLMKGNWQYKDAGIMDHTHLRFFTRRTISEAIKDSGFIIMDKKMIIHGRKKNIANRLTFGFLEEYLGSQILIRARNRFGGKIQ